MPHSPQCIVCGNHARTELYEPGGIELCVRCDIILRRISDRLVPLYDVEPDRITVETAWVEDLGTDSLDAAELMVALEEEFGAGITDAEAQKFKVVADLVRLLAGRIRR